MKIPNWIKQRAYLTPNRPAITYEEQTLTFFELYERVSQTAGKLAKLGVKQGEHIGVLSKNQLDFAILLYSLQHIGAISVLINTRLSAAEINFQLTEAKINRMILDHAFLQYRDQLEVPTVLFSELDQTEENNLFKEMDYFQMEDVCSMMFTSGTTGNPKAVQQSYQNHWWSAIGSALNLGLSEKDTWMCAVPLFHISGYSILIKSMVYGMHVRLYHQFNPSQINQDIVEEKGSILSVVTTMATQLLDEIRESSYPSSFRCMLLGGGPAPLSILEACKRKNIPVYQTYGMTETASQIVTLAPEDSMRKLGSAGKPLFPCEVKIMKDNNQALPFEEGEICVKGPNVTKGYYFHPKANEESFVGDWFYTGDIGLMDEEGYLYILDRRSDLIISGGENIYPAEIENVLIQHPNIEDAGVVGMKNNRWGEVPVAYVKATNISKDEIKRWCADKLAPYKQPKQIVMTKDPLPRNATNKLLRRELKGRLEASKDED
ncbi:O-succinylbenzoic acid--CoA ligase [Bacillus coahuilensis m2-6]|uniref:o-succinylbenzoate--CoA ligase n=1 Tax=Bacillus coahuilensis TaxID=408580 RepID=UPI0007506B8A|nr:o-succinylbenzoate--CoA ligase [Bacillus coahuilensis]KUP06351.1 O-succinylbenzoic acid--CoA ligase [Bacillus coahuilensis m2-6]